MRSPARIHWRIHESIHSGVHVGIHAGLHDRIHESIHKGAHDSVHEGIHGGVHEIPPRLLDRMPDVYTKQVLHIHLIPQGVAPRPVSECMPPWLALTTTDAVTDSVTEAVTGARDPGWLGVKGR
jgi:hypothetical protein